MMDYPLGKPTPVILWQSCVAPELEGHTVDGAVFCHLPDRSLSMMTLPARRSALNLPHLPKNPVIIMFLSIQGRNRFQAARNLFRGINTPDSYGALKTESGVYPEIVDAPEVFEYSYLSAYFHDIMLNPDVTFIPLSLLPERTKDMKQGFFVRSNSGNKIFAGQTVVPGEARLFIDTIKIPEASTLCAVASPKVFHSETRVWVDTENSKIIATAPYQHEGEPVSTGIPESELQPFIQRMAQRNILPDIVVADFCKTENGSIKLVEINSVSTSGTYGVAKKVLDYLIAHLTKG